jgi:hypothetical protein
MVPAAAQRTAAAGAHHHHESGDSMTWFKVDDSFYDHPKMYDASDASVALWIRAGTWSARNLTDGFVPTGMLARLSGDARTATAELCNRGMWLRTRGGYQFHDWHVYQITKEESVAARSKMSSGGALGNHRRWHGKEGKSDPDCRYCQHKQPSGSDRPPDRVGRGQGESGAKPPGPSRPGPLRGGPSETTTDDRASPTPPPPQCPKHIDDPEPGPCGQCADARRARERWDLADADRRRTSAKCRKHRGQPADTCGLCRADRLADPDA